MATIEERYDAVRKAAPAAIKSFLQRGEQQLAAFIERHLVDEGAGSDDFAGAKIGARSGRLSRALIPGQPGHLGRLNPPSEGSLTRGPFGIKYGIDTRVIRYAAVHEYGKKITATPKMIAYFWYLFMLTGVDKWKIIALSARRKGFVKIKARPYFAPGVDEWAKQQAPKELARVQTQLVKVFNGR